MSLTDCPKCFLPKDDNAWQCDGCGFEFRQDFDNVRSELQAELARTRTVFWGTLVVDVGIVAGIVYLATLGFFYISVPLMVAVIGSIGHAAHRRSVLREHLTSFNRRHPPLPTATVHRGAHEL